MSRAQLTSTVEQNTGGAVAPFVAGKNKIINGDFGIWQRGTSQTITTSTYSADRFTFIFNGTQSIAASAQTFTPGNTIAGYEPTYYGRFAVGSSASGQSYNQFGQTIEDVRQYAGQTITFSFWAKTTSGSFTINPRYIQYFGSGGTTPIVEANFGSGAITLTTSWTRYTATVALPSITGKTIGTGSSLKIVLDLPQNTTWSLDTWGWQLEAGSVATPFITATGTLSGELTACQRYYYQVANGTIGPVGGGFNNGTTTMETVIQFPVTMRTTPTISQAIGTDYYVFNRAGANDGFNSLTVDRASQSLVICYNSTEISGTSGNAGWVYTNNASAFLSFQAEL